MVDFGRECHARSSRSRYEFDAMGAVALAAKCISEDRACAWLAELDGSVVGLLLGATQRWPYLKASFATDILFVSQKPGAGKRLLAAFVAWAEEHGAEEVRVAISDGDSKAKDRIYTRAGFSRIGSRFMKEL